jgi:hypothetical protein
MARAKSRTKSKVKRTRASASAGRKKAARTKAPAGRATARHYPLDGFIDAAAAAFDLRLEVAWKDAVKTNLEVTLRLARTFADFPLPDDAEPAPVFVA